MDCKVQVAPAEIAAFALPTASATAWSFMPNGPGVACASPTMPFSEPASLDTISRIRERAFLLVSHVPDQRSTVTAVVGPDRACPRLPVVVRPLVFFLAPASFAVVAADVGEVE